MSAGVFTESERPCGEGCFDNDPIAVAIETGVQMSDQSGGRRANKYKVTYTHAATHAATNTMAALAGRGNDLVSSTWILR